MEKLIDFIPEIGKNFATYGKEDVVNRLGEPLIRKTVLGILNGENIRSLTESLTKRRVTISAAAMFKTYIEAYANIPDFSERYSEILFDSITKKKLTKSEKSFLTWMAGLTEK